MIVVGDGSSRETATQSSHNIKQTCHSSTKVVKVTQIDENYKIFFALYPIQEESISCLNSLKDPVWNLIYLKEADKDITMTDLAK